MKFRIEKKQPVPLLVEVMRRRGWTQTDGSDWHLLWSAEPPENYGRSDEARFANHHRQVVLLDNKASLGRLLTAARRRATLLGGGARWDFFPVTYELPFERDDFLCDARAHPGRVWIAKPSAGTHGDGQYLFTNPEEAPTGQDWVVQHYLAAPHLLDGRKYTLRLYVALTSLAPLVAHIYTEGLIKRSTVAYSDARGDLGNRLIHLTNSDVQRASPQGAPPGMSLAELRAAAFPDETEFATLWTAIRFAATRVLLATRDALLHANPPGAQPGLRRFDLLGLDFLIDAQRKPWLLEVNTNPSLRVETPAGIAGHEAERSLKLALLENVLHLAGVFATAPADCPPESAHGFERLFPVPEAAAWSSDWYPSAADAALFAALRYRAPAFPCVPLPPGAVLTSEGLLAFAPGSARLLAFNESATAIALWSDEGRSREDICTDLTRHAADSPPRETVLAHIDEVLKSLWSLRVPVFLRFPHLVVSPPGPVAEGGCSVCYALGTFRFRVHFAEQAFADIASEPLRHLRMIEEGSAMHPIEVARDGGKFVVRSAIESFESVSVAVLPSLLNSAMLRVFCRSSETSVAFHAAGVSHAGHALVLAGPSGAGKSTLAAALLAAGFAYFSDEATILNARFHLQPAPVALGLMSDVLPLLAPALPETASAPVRERRNGAPVHFLAPRQIADAPRPVLALVFPRIATGEPTALKPIGPVTALTLLGAGGLALPRPLDLASGRALVEWLQHTLRFELTVGSLEAATAILRDLCESGSERMASISKDMTPVRS